MKPEYAAAPTDAAAGGRVEKTTLSNGLRILSEQIPGMASAAVGLWVESGSRFESAAQNGLSHFLEHLFFKGTERRSAIEIAESIDAIGGLLNADTDREHTCYYAKVLGEHATLAIDLLSDIFLASSFAPEEVAREKNVVLEEIAQIEDTPDDLINDLFHQAYWPAHALGRPVCGTRETVAAFDRDACRSWLQHRYRPDRIVVAAAGDVRHGVIVDEIARRFGDLTGSAPLDDVALPMLQPGVTLHRRRLEQVQLCFGTRGVTVTDAERDVAVVLNSVLGDSPSSRLFQEVRERRGRAYSIDSFLCSYRDTGYLGISAGTRPRWVAEVVDIVIGELKRLRVDAVPAAELARAKGKLKGTLWLGLETSDQRMERIALNEMYFGRQVAPDEIAARLDAVTSEEIAGLATRLFTPETCALVLLGDMRGTSVDAAVFGGALVISRYTRPVMGEIWTDAARYRRWLEIELLACEALAERGEIPKSAVRAMRRRARIDPERIAVLEAEVKHDIIAFVTQVAETVGPEGRFLHLGLTSSDVLDTGFALQLRAAADLLRAGQDRLIAALARLARAHKKTLMIGRTHGMHAEPVTFGVKVASWHAEAVRNRTRLVAATNEIAVGTLSGAVGVFGNVSPDVERYVLDRLALVPEPVATQVVARDRHAAFFSTLAVLGASIERIALEIRHMQRTEVGEAEEPFTTGQKGSSAMPHKRNPILSENVTGLARLLRAYAGAALENVALWHERDISHSSVERVIAPDATIALDFMLARMTGVLENLVVRPERMRANLDLSGGVVLSENVLLALVQKGAARQDAYRWVQRAAHASLAGASTFRDALAAEPEIRKRLSVRDLEHLLDPGRHLEHLDLLFRRGLATTESARRRQSHQRPTVRKPRGGAK